MKNMRLPLTKKSQPETKTQATVKPKRPLSAYMFFVQLNRATVTKNLINRSAKEVGTKLGSIWKNLPSTVKQKFESLALVDKNRYIEAKKKYISNNAFVRVVKPRNSYVIFSIQQRPVIKQQRPELTFVEVNQIITNHWKILTEEEKEPYEDQSEADKIRYIQEVNNL
jgi:hypothetical protein